MPSEPVGWTAVVISFASLVISVRNHLRDRRKDANDCIAEYDTIERQKFWGLLRKAYAEYRKLHPELAEDMDKFILQAGAPPNLPNHPDQTVATWIERNEFFLKQNVSKRCLWEFASAIYPEDDRIEGTGITRTSLIARTLGTEKFQQFDATRSLLAKFYKRRGGMIQGRFMKNYFKSASLQVCALAWLELALARQTKDAGQGKVGLFRLAERMN